VAATAACSRERDDRFLETKGYGEISAPSGVNTREGPATDMAVASAPQAAVATAENTAEQAPAQALADSIRTTMLIRNGAATLKVKADSLDTAVAQVRALAARVNGYVTNVAMQAGEQQIRQAILTIRLPAARFDDAVAALRSIGEVESVNVTTEDVGEEYVDVQMRLANARRLEERLLELLGTRTGTLEHVLTIERELARVREQIERLEGRLRYLRNRVDLSTLAVTVHEPGPLLAGQPGQNVLLRSLRQAMRNFIGFLAVVIESLGVVLPLAALGWVGWLVYRRVRRGRARVKRAHTIESPTAG
jgi:hypothetical protein